MIYLHEPLLGDVGSIFGGQAYTRVIADSDDELHEFGELLGLQLEWIQTEPCNHFKVSGIKLQLALSREEAQYLSMKEFEDYFKSDK